jgi:AcrR family transcriptional regulator
MPLGLHHPAPGDDPSSVDPDRRRAIARAGISVAQQRGYHGTTAARVAAVAGVDEDEVEAAFPERAGLLRAALELAFRDWYEEVPTWKDVEPLPDLRDEIERRLVTGVAAGRRAADFWRLGLQLSLEPALAGSDIGEVFLDVRERTRLALRDYWARILLDIPGADPEVVELAVRSHLALTDGAMLATHAAPHWDLERLMSVVASGIAAVMGRGSISARSGEE